MDSIVQILRQRALEQPSQRSYTFLQDALTEAAYLTYGELDRRARGVAFQLQALGVSGQCALLLYPAGLEFIVAFLGCLYAGVTAIPTPVPHFKRPSPRLQAVLTDSGAKVALTTSQIVKDVEQRLPTRGDLATVQWVATDMYRTEDEPAWQPPSIDADTVAYLQYTSGSTASPKGVMITHRHLLANSADIAMAAAADSTSVLVSWMPHYHDFGLVYGIIQPLYQGFPCFLMAPAAFMQRPVEWLRAITHYRATQTGAPNFAYELCAQKITPQERAVLDLSSLAVAASGGERIRQATLDLFANTFKAQGFRMTSFMPSYGLAEATLRISSAPKNTAPLVIALDAKALRDGLVVDAHPTDKDAQSLVSCGVTVNPTRIAIVNPDTLQRCEPNKVGEIWVAGPGVGAGYWQRPLETQESFQAYLADSHEGPFLRTGDLGFLRDDQLFVTGRLKDMIIIRGANYYPQDIELTVAQSHPALLLDAGAAFAVDDGRNERLVVVQEVARTHLPRLDMDAVFDQIHQAIAESYQIAVDTIVLVKPNRIPKTSSGKIQRQRCRTLYLDEQLEDLIGSWRRPTAETIDRSPRNGVSIQQQLGQIASANRLTVLETYLQQQLGKVLRIPAAQVALDKPVTTLGIDSLAMTELIYTLESTLDLKIPLEQVLQSDSLHGFAAHLLTRIDRKAAVAGQTLLDRPLTIGHSPSTNGHSRAGNEATSIRDAQHILANLPQMNVVVAAQQGRKLQVDGRWIYDFASCNYLGLDLHPGVMAAIPPALEKWGVHPSWTRAVASPGIYAELEQELAALTGAPNVLVFPAITLLHAGVIPILAGADGVILKDIAAHQSIHEACRLAQSNGAEYLNFRHNDVGDLAEKLARYPLERTKLIAIDGVYSMSGAYPPLADYARLAEAYNATIYIDDAHGVGVIGENPTLANPYGSQGNGIIKHLGLDYVADRLIYVGGLSKAFSSFGAFITCADEAAKNRLRTASTFIFSGPSPVASLASALAGLRLNRQEGDAWRSKVYRLTEKLVTAAKALGLEVINENCFPIVSVVIGKTEDVVAACHLLWEHGILITPAIFPVVPPERGLVRFSITAANTEEEIDCALEALAAVQERLQMSGIT